jgi:signal transduction histidine kinase/PAS domain-containing protein
MKTQTPHSPLTIDYKNLFQSLTAAYIVFDVDDPNFTILEENEAHAAIAMQKRNNVVGRSLFDVFPDLSEKYKTTGVSDLLESIRKVIRTGEHDILPTLHYDLLDPNGQPTQMYWHVSHHPVLDEQGKVVGVYQATTDITDKILTKRKLDNTQNQLSQALSYGMIGTWTWNMKIGKVYAGENLSRMFGIDYKIAKKGIDLEVFLDSIHPGDRERVTREIDTSIKSNKKYESEYRTIDGNGDVRWMIARGQIEYDESGEPESFPGVVVDVTDRKATENNLNFLTLASTQFSSSLDPKKTLATIAGMVVPDIADWCTIDLLEDGEIQRVATAHKDPKKVKWANELYKKQGGAPDLNEPTGVAKVIRTGEMEYYPEITDAMLVAAAKDKAELQLVRDIGFSSCMILPLQIGSKIIGSITLISTESKIHYKQADIEVAKALANRAATAVDNARLYQSAQREIKERKLLQEQLLMANDVLDSRVAERTSQLIDTNEGLEKEIKRREKVESELQENSKNLARSNQELQDFAYVASHDLQEPLRKIQAFGDLLESEYKDSLGEGVEYLIRMRSAASRMSILIQDLLAFSRVSTKPQEVQQVDLKSIVKDVVSDLETSISETDGAVVLSDLPSVWADPTHMRQLFQNLIGNALKFHQDGLPPKVIITVRAQGKNDKFCEIHVTDNGIGFDEKYLDRIFSVFQRLHGREQYEGTGIGLAVCRKIVERYGGSIDAKSKLNSGSTFIIKLPITRKEQAHERS